MKKTASILSVALAAAVLLPASARASSHQDAPLITLDPSANTTDVYAFVSVQGGVKYLTAALSVYPFEEPGIGPNIHNFDDEVLYRINVATGANVAAGTPTFSYDFRFQTTYKNQQTIAQSYLGVIQQVDDASQNLTQRYSVIKRGGVPQGRGPGGGDVVLFDGAIVPPNNQGLVTPLYNQGNNGENLAKEGVALAGNLDPYTASTVFTNGLGYSVFAGQRDDGFYADIQSIFDLDFSFGGPNKPFDSQGGFNVHTIVINIPLTELGGDQQVVGVWATTSRRQINVLRDGRASGGRGGDSPDNTAFGFIQVGRQGNPLFCEGLVPIVDKNRYNQQPPSQDAATQSSGGRGPIQLTSAGFAQYALAPELAVLLGAQPDRRTNRTDLAAIFIPDLIKVDLSTAAARLAGGSAVGAAPDDAGFHRLGIFGGDTLTSTVQAGFGGGTVPGGWPNGRRFGDDVLDIAVIAILSDLRTSPPQIFGSPATDIDKVTANDIGYNKVFPYAATPLNGRNHGHH